MINPSEISEVLRQQLESVNAKVSFEETGTVLEVGDGVCHVYGLDNVCANELVEFENGAKGVALNLEESNVGVILLNDINAVTEGMKVKRTGEIASIPVGEGLFGRVINVLGEPIDGRGPIAGDRILLPLERKAPGVIYRQPVKQPLQTGLKAIDAMVPIGRGQRELIIGDRQTGKTSIAIDTILNQKDKNVLCVYVAIGQKASTVAQIVSNLKKRGAMDYTVVVSATASEPASLQYLAPYSGTAMAEYFMDQGRDVLIVYDDLSKHAVAYRALSLLLERSPGREAYPGDVFYLHSRLLERSSRMDEAHGGGSLTALPIVETQGGDVSAYIPTNVISITDGQLFLESDLFFAGSRPAIHVGLSVSRVGGAAQTRAMKKAAGTLRIDLAQYRELEAFSQFSSELDPETKDEITYGAQLMELLKQPLYQPKPMEQQVVLLCAAAHRAFLPVPVPQVRAAAQAFYQQFAAQHADTLAAIRTTGQLTDEAQAEILRAAADFVKGRGYGKQ